MEKVIHLCTTNPGKVSSLQRVLNEYGISVRHANIELPELQILDISKIAKHKAEFAYDRIKKPVVTQDTGFFLDAWPGFPGVFVKFTLDTLDLEGYLSLVNGRTRKCEFRECIAYNDDRGIFTFESIVPGELAREPRGVLPSFAWSKLWRLFVPEGNTKTLAEMTDEERSLWRKRRGDNSVVLFAKWFIDNR